MHAEDQYLIDFFTEDVNHLYVWIALQDLSENFDEDWNKYENIVEELNMLPYSWKREIDDSRKDSQKIYQEYKEILSWISFNENKIDKRLDELFPDDKRTSPIEVFSLISF